MYYYDCYRHCFDFRTRVLVSIRSNINSTSSTSSDQQDCDRNLTIFANEELLEKKPRISRCHCTFWINLRWTNWLIQVYAIWKQNINLTTQYGRNVMKLTLNVKTATGNGGRKLQSVFCMSAQKALKRVALKDTFKDLRHIATRKL